MKAALIVFALLVALCAANIRSVQEVEAEGAFLPALSRRQSVSSVPVDPQAASPLVDLMRQHNEQVAAWDAPRAVQAPPAAVQPPVASHAELASASALAAQDDMVAVAVESDEKSLVDDAAHAAPAAPPASAGAEAPTGANAGPALTVEQQEVREEPQDTGALAAEAAVMAMDPQDAADRSEDEGAQEPDAMSAAGAVPAAEAAPAVEVVNAQGSAVPQEESAPQEQEQAQSDDAQEDAEDAAVGEAPAAETSDDPVRAAAQEVEQAVPVQQYAADPDRAPARLHRADHHADAAAPEEAEEQRFQRHKFLITTLDKKQEVGPRHGHQQERDVEDDAGIEAHQDERMHVNPPDHSRHWENRHKAEHVHAEHEEQPGDHHHAHPLEGHHDAAPHHHHKHHGKKHHGKHHNVVQKVQAPVKQPAAAAHAAEADHAEFARKVGAPASPAMVAAAALGLGEKHFGHEEAQEARKGFLADMQGELAAYAEAHEEPPAAAGVGDGPLQDQAALDEASAEARAEEAAKQEDDKEAVAAQHAGFADSEIDRLMDATNDAPLGPFDAARERTDGNVYRRTRPLGNFRVANKRAKAPERKHRVAIDCDLPGSSFFASFLQLGQEEGKTLQEKPQCVACVQILGYYAQKKSMNYCNCLRKMPSVDAARKDACAPVEKKLTGEMQQWLDLRKNGCIDNGKTYGSCPDDVTCGILGYC